MPPHAATRAAAARLAIACAAVVAALCLPTLSSGASLGVFRGPATPQAIAGYGDWLGREPAAAVDFFARADWDDIVSPTYWLEGWEGSPYQLVFSVAMVPESGGYTLAQGAAGAYDHYFETLAQNLAAHGFGDAVIRLGWEFNGGWYVWSALPDPASFVSYWRRIVDTMRAVPGTNFRFDWNPILGGASVEHMYPGDAYVDVIGLDIYDQFWNPAWQDPAARWQKMLYEPAGLVWHRDFARAHGKLISFPEWGLVSADGEAGGGDNPYFIQRMYEWVGQNIDDVAYYAYFEFPGTIGNHSLMSGEFPQSAALFRELFSTEPPKLPHDPPLPGAAAPVPSPDPPASDAPPVGDGGEAHGVVDEPLPPGAAGHVRVDAGPALRIFGARDGASVARRPKLAVYLAGDAAVTDVRFRVGGRLVCRDETEPYRCRPTLAPGWNEVDITASTRTGHETRVLLRLRFQPRRTKASANPLPTLPTVGHRRHGGIPLDPAILAALS